MIFSAIARGIVVNFIADILLVFFLVYYQFNLTEEVFAISILTILLLVSAYTGSSSEKFGHLNGSLVGLGSSLVLFCFLAQFVDLSWELNAWLSSVWLTVGYFGGLIGFKLLKKKDSKEVSSKKKKKHLNTQKTEE